MQVLLGTRTAADINLMAQLLLLAGLLAGFILARRKRFAQHANIQTAMVLLNLALIALFMVPSFYGYVIASRSVSDPVAQLMIGHGVLGIIVELVALYLILLMRTRLIPKQFRLGNIKLAMRATLALWTVLVLLGIGIYTQRYLMQSAAASAPLLEFRQLGADLYVHAVELADAQTRGSLPATRRHAEHLVNLIEGAQGPHYGDIDGNSHLEDPGDGIGLFARLGAVADVGGSPGAAQQATTIREQLDRIVALSLDLIGDQPMQEMTPVVEEILTLARQTNVDGVFALESAARTAGVVQAPSLAGVAQSTGESVSVTIHEDRYQFIPSQLTIPAGTTVIWVNDEQAKHTASADDGDFDSGDQELGVRYEYTFTEPGTYRYFCRYHGDVGGVGMAGTIVVE
jgi:plastocyanin